MKTFARNLVMALFFTGAYAADAVVGLFETRLLPSLLTIGLIRNGKALTILLEAFQESLSSPTAVTTWAIPISQPVSIAQ